MIQKFPYHLVDQSPWPLLTSFSLLITTLGAALYLHFYTIGIYVLSLGLLSLTLCLFLWFKDVVREATFQGHHTVAVKNGIKFGLVLFILSEVLFFFGFFWAFFHSSLVPAVSLGSVWPPLGIHSLNPWEIPLLNSVILLSSGASITWAHHSLVAKDRKSALFSLYLTIFLAAIFTLLQGYEYFHSEFTIADGVYGSTFYMATGSLPAAAQLDHSSSKEGPIKTLNPYWITGFADAESSFVLKISQRDRNFPWYVIPTFSIELHERDISLLFLIKNYFGVGSILKRVRDGRSSAIYSVQSLNDLVTKIIPHFNNFPMLTQKQADFLLFCKAIDLILTKKHLNLDGFNLIISIRSSMNKGLTSKLKLEFPNIIPLQRPLISQQIIKDPYWLVGFVDGEGCFYVKLNNNLAKRGSKTPQLSFSISQHLRDYPLLEIIKNYLDCGLLEKVSTRPSSATYVTYKFEDIEKKIIKFFKNYPLLGLKLLDFKDFVKVAELLKKELNFDRPIAEGSRADTINKIKIIKSVMNKGRKLFPQ